MIRRKRSHSTEDVIDPRSRLVILPCSLNTAVITAFLSLCTNILSMTYVLWALLLSYIVDRQHRALFTFYYIVRVGLQTWRRLLQRFPRQEPHLMPRIPISKGVLRNDSLRWPTSSELFADPCTLGFFLTHISFISAVCLSERQRPRYGKCTKQHWSINVNCA